MLTSRKRNRMSWQQTEVLVVFIWEHERINMLRVTLCDKCVLWKSLLILKKGWSILHNIAKSKDKKESSHGEVIKSSREQALVLQFWQLKPPTCHFYLWHLCRYVEEMEIQHASLTVENTCMDWTNVWLAFPQPPPTSPPVNVSTIQIQLNSTCK